MWIKTGPLVNVVVTLTCLDVGVTVRPVENGQLHQLHLLQIILSFRLEQTNRVISSDKSLHCATIARGTWGQKNHLGHKIISALCSNL